MKAAQALLGAALAVAGTVGWMPPASACPPATSCIEQAPRTADEVVVSRATDLLNGGQNREAIQTLYESFGLDINLWALNSTVFGEREHEIVLIVALAVLRTEGTVERDETADAATGQRKADNVRWAVRAMENLAFVDYVPQRHLVEAWGRDPSLKRAALEKLEALDSDGKLQSRFQFALLKRLRDEVGGSPERT